MSGHDDLGRRRVRSESRRAARRERRRSASRALLAGLVAWSLFTVGGAYAWAGVPIVIAAGLLFLLARPRIGPVADTWTLDASLIAAAIAAGAQLVPLPRAIHSLLSPGYEPLLRQIFVVPAAREWRQLSLDPASTGYAVALAVAVIFVFWAARHICGRGGTGAVVWTVALCGLAASVIAVVQVAAAPTLIYGLWEPLDAGARPFGPFVNRNHFATWALMALPLAAGALATAAAGRRPAQRIAGDIASLASAMDARGMWITVSAAALLLALIASSSRAALTGCAGALVMWIALMRSRIGRRGRWLGWTVAAVLVAFLLTFASLQRIVSRADETLGSGAGSRPQIWRDTLDVMTAFPIAGAGLGAFQTAMLGFQSSDRQTFTNQAHNQYLQMAAEGGLLVAIPALVVIALFARLAAARLATDASHLVWIRIGAIAGLTAVAVQSLWETGLRMPANAVLFAVVAAIALHRPGTVHATTPHPDPPSSPW